MNPIPIAREVEFDRIAHPSLCEFRLDVGDELVVPAEQAIVHRIEPVTQRVGAGRHP